MTVQLVLRPGYIMSKTDGDIHFISADKLADLYGVRLSKCVVVHDQFPYLRESSDVTYVHLYPRYDGDYGKIIDTQELI